LNDIMRTNGNNSITEQPVIGVTMGDPAGIGPEIIVKALADPAIRRAAKFVVFGMNEQLCYAADAAEIEPFWGRHQHEKISREYPFKVVVADYDEYYVPSWVKGPSKLAGEASTRFCLDAIDAARDGIIDAIVTAPISKKSWKLAGGDWPGHTEMLAARCKAPRKVMMFIAGPLKVALATIHEALFDVRNKFTIGCVFEPIDLLNDALKQYFDIENPRIGVAALNPHAGEDGQFGDEEQRIISPAMLLAQEQGINCLGPFSADTLFLRPGDDTRQTARLRGSGQCHDRHPHHQDVTRSRDSVRHCRPKSRESGQYKGSNNHRNTNGKNEKEFRMPN